MPPPPRGGREVPCLQVWGLNGCTDFRYFGITDFTAIGLLNLKRNTYQSVSYVPTLWFYFR